MRGRVQTDAGVSSPGPSPFPLPAGGPQVQRGDAQRTCLNVVARKGRGEARPRERQGVGTAVGTGPASSSQSNLCVQAGPSPMG
jgi:hypothetical protein